MDSSLKYVCMIYELDSRQCSCCCWTNAALRLTQSGTPSGSSLVKTTSLVCWSVSASSRQLARARLACGGGACAGRGCACGDSSDARPERNMYLNCSICCMTSRICTSARPFSPAAADLHLPEFRSTCNCVLWEKERI